jgi:hypothetical protein
MYWHVLKDFGEVPAIFDALDKSKGTTKAWIYVNMQAIQTRDRAACFTSNQDSLEIIKLLLFVFDIYTEEYLYFNDVLWEECTLA